ncbi:MAG TPA: ATP-binding protein [Xanthomonadales bacterium]|nr:ATP-binding protein [Xanthomonadales bacterium]
MRLKGTLILILLAAFALPWAGWQLIAQMEALLREGQERAQIGAAQAIARAFVAAVPDAPPPAGSLYVHEGGVPPLVDGSGDDWNGLEPVRSADGSVSATLRDDGTALYALIAVRDATRVRADAGNPLGTTGDRVAITLRDATGLRSWTIGNAAPGTIQVLGATPVPSGEWTETNDGYLLELRLPRPLEPAALGVAVVDEGAAGGRSERNLAATGSEPMPLIRRETRLDRVLATLVPEGARVRFVSADGWVLGRGGDLALPATEAASRWQAFVYRMLLAPPAENAAEFANDRERLDAQVVWQALSGIAASSVRASTAANTVVVAAAVPVVRGGQPTGVLLLEQASGALLVLANRAVFGLIAASLVTVLIAALILFAYAGVLSLRIRRLRNAAERALRPDGRLDLTLPHLAARDDLGDLSRSFSRLLGEIGTYTDYLRTLASKLSHELNTPLAIVRSSLDNLEHEALGESARTYAQRARDGAERLSVILRSMAEASRMERAIQAAEGEDFDLAPLVRGCADAYRDLAAPRRIALQLDVPTHTLHGAPELIAQALDKLVDNARSFTPEDGWIRIRLSATADSAELAVANNGPPLPAKMQDRLFDSLVSVRNSGGGERAPPVPHLGLGLFIVRLVAELHGGEARAVNLPDGAGVEFRLSLRGMPRKRL